MRQRKKLIFLHSYFELKTDGVDDDNADILQREKNIIEKIERGSYLFIHLACITLTWKKTMVMSPMLHYCCRIMCRSSSVINFCIF